MKKIILIVLGCLLTAMGSVGLFLPILPTTPFLILAAICFSSSSERLHRGLLKNRYFGAYIRNFKDKTGVSRRVKIHTLIFLWVCLAISGLLCRQTLAWIILAAVGVGVTLHVLLIKTRKDDDTP